MILKYINIDNKYKTIRQVLKDEFYMSNRFISKLKQHQAILLNNQPMYIDKELELEDIITVIIELDETSSGIVPVKLDFSILYEDEALLVVNKPPFMPVHPSSSHFTDTLSNAVQYYYNEQNYTYKNHLVNRLDRDTSGIVVFAKNGYIKECLIKQMKENIFKKEYIAFLEGSLEQDCGTINAPIARKPDSIIERQIHPDGDFAITHFEKQKDYPNYCMVKFWLQTGRTHQIRVHSSYIGHPILGDTLYGHASSLINRQALHAYKVTFIHPLTKKEISFTAPLPLDMEILKKW